MVGQGRVTGIVLIAIGLILGLILVLWLGSNLATGKLQISGFIFGLALLLILALPLLGVGVFLFVQGGAEVKEMAEVEKEKKLLGMVQTQGKVMISSAAIELGLNRDQVKNYIYDLVNKGLFTGYIDWKSGTLYAKEAAEMQTNKCPNCGATRELVGKGIVKCEYCGAELFV